MPTLASTLGLLSAANLGQLVRQLVAIVAQLSQSSADAVREVFAEAASANTTRSYATALRYWAGTKAATEWSSPCRWTRLV